MKRGLILVFCSSVLATIIVYCVQRGCGTVLSTIPVLLGWKILRAMGGPLFSDSHEYLVFAVASVLSSSCLTMLLALLGIVGRTRGFLVPRSRMAAMLIGGVVLYVVLLVVAFPIQECP
jgi:hypothetical protein